MYKAEEVRERFIAEVNRLLDLQAAPNLYQMEQACKLKPGDMWRIHERKILDIRAVIIANFVQTYRAYDVSYEYIFEGKKPVQVQQEIKEELKRQLQLHLATL